jgi:hypothetical protein
MKTMGRCIFAFLLLAHGQAHAAELNEARGLALFDQGEAAWKGGDYGRARDLFSESYEAFPRAITLADLGLTEGKLGHSLEALKDLRKAAAWPGLDAKRREVIEGNLRRAMAQAGHLAVQASEGATVSIDGTAVDLSSEPIDVLPGHHVVEAKLEDRRAQQEVDAPAGSVVDVKVTVPPRGSVLPSVIAAASASPPPPVVAPAPAPMSPEPSWWTGPRIAGVALGAAALGAGVTGLGFHFAGEGVAQDLKDLRGALSNGQCWTAGGSGSCDAVKTRLDNEHTDNVATVVSLSLAGAFALASTCAFAAGARSGSGTSASIAPVVSPTMLGMAGRF